MREFTKRFMLKILYTKVRGESVSGRADTEGSGDDEHKCNQLQTGGSDQRRSQDERVEQRKN